MIKECVVKTNNEAVTVVTYGNVDVQLPSIHRKAKTVFVNFEDGKYKVVNENHEPKGATVKKKCTNKKTTIKEVTKESGIDIEDKENV